MAVNQPVMVMVTGVGGGSLGEQILKALKLAETPYEIVGGDIDPHSLGLALVDHPYILPPAKDPGYLDALLSVCRRHGVKALFPGSEAELLVLCRNRQWFETDGPLVFTNPEEVVDICQDKARTAAFLAAHGFSPPNYLEISSREELEAVGFLPAVLKPSVGGGGSVNTFLAQTRAELMFYGSHMLETYPRFICQEYVGRADQEYTVGVLMDMEGRLINSIAVRRHILPNLSNRLKIPNRSGREELGPVLAISNGVSQGEIGPFPEVTGPCEKVALALGCTSAVNIQCRMVDGRPLIFEINPRFSGTTSLRALVGYNEPDVLVRRHVLGQAVRERFFYGSGIIMRGLREVLVGGAGRTIPRAPA